MKKQPQIVTNATQLIQLAAVRVLVDCHAPLAMTGKHVTALQTTIVTASGAKQSLSITNATRLIELAAERTLMDCFAALARMTSNKLQC